MYQKMAEKTTSRQAGRHMSNRTGIPEPLKQRFEASSGMSFDDVRIHYNSGKPAEIGAYAYTRGNQVYLSPGQERHLSHELGHVVQQKAGMVRPTAWRRGLPVNTDPGLERMADNPFRVLGGASRQAQVEDSVCVQGKWRRMNFMRRNCFLCEVEAKSLPRSVRQLLNLTEKSPPVTLLMLQGEPDTRGKTCQEVYANGILLPEDMLEEVLAKAAPGPQDDFHFSTSGAYSTVAGNLDTRMDYLRRLNRTAAQMPRLREERDEESPSPAQPDGAPLDYQAEFLRLRERFSQEDEIVRREIERTWKSILHIESSLTEMELPQLEKIRDTLPAQVKQIAMDETRRYLAKQYRDACDAVLQMRKVGRTRRQPYQDALKMRGISLERLKHVREPLPEIRERVQKELDQKFEDWSNNLKSSVDKKAGQGGSIQATRTQLRKKSLLVLPDGLPLAGVFPDSDAHQFTGNEKRRSFPDLRVHADSLVKKYQLYCGDDGIIDGKQGCVCIMYLREKTGPVTLYRPAFGISGFFRKNRDAMSIGIAALGIPEALLSTDKAHKPDALFNFIYMCNILGLRKPSIQAMLTYLQSDPEYGNVERWNPVMCAEPAIVMAIRNLWHVTSELVLSFPYQGHLALQPGDSDKTPLPKYTCARCAMVEYAFGAAVFDAGKGTRGDDVYVDREKVAMDKEDRRDKLFSPNYITNADQTPFSSYGSAYEPGKMRPFLDWTEELGIYHVRAEELLARLGNEIGELGETLSKLEETLPKEAAQPGKASRKPGVSPQAAVIIQIEFLKKIRVQLEGQPNLPQPFEDLTAQIKKLITSLTLEMLHPVITQPKTVPDKILEQLSSLVSKTADLVPIDEGA